MIRSAGRILTTHAGALPRPKDLWPMVVAKASGQPYDRRALPARLKSAVAEAVRKQVECGLDSVNDGELSKTSFTSYVRERLSGFEAREHKPGEDPKPLSIMSRDMRRFSEYFAGRQGGWLTSSGVQGCRGSWCAETTARRSRSPGQLRICRYWSAPQ